MTSDETPDVAAKLSTESQPDIMLTWRERLHYLYPSILSMIFSLFVTYLVLLSNPYLYPGMFPPIASLIETILILLVIGLIGGIATFATFMVFQRGSELLHRILIAAFVSPLFFILTVFVGQAIFLVLVFQGLTNLHLSLIAMASIMFSAFAVVFIFTDALGTAGRNAIFTIYGIILGVFIGVNFTWFISMALLIILAIQDTIFATRLGPTIVEADQQAHVRTAFTFAVGPLVIGVGDLIVYAALVAYALRYLGWLFTAVTFSAILLGCLINTQIVARYPNKAIPGLPIPLICALFPISIGLGLISFGIGGIIPFI